MRKIYSLFIIAITIFALTSCNNNIVPKGYISQKTYSDASIEQIGHTIQYTIFKYENCPNLSKNKFLENVTDEDITLLEIFLIDYNSKLEEYDSISDTHEFKENFKVDIKNISKGYFHNEKGHHPCSCPCSGRRLLLCTCFLLR